MLDAMHKVRVVAFKHVMHVVFKHVMVARMFKDFTSKSLNYVLLQYKLFSCSVITRQAKIMPDCLVIAQLI